MNPQPPGPQPGALTELSYGHHETNDSISGPWPPLAAVQPLPEPEEWPHTRNPYARARALDATLGDATEHAATSLPLAGVPFAAKNLFDIAGLTTRAGTASTAARR